MLKKAPITVIKSGTVHNGKYLVLIGGSVASVEESYTKGLAIDPDKSIEMNVTGFRDALNDAILVHLSEGLDVRFVSLPGMAVLKIIAWRDRHNEFQ